MQSTLRWFANRARDTSFPHRLLIEAARTRGIRRSRQSPRIQPIHQNMPSKFHLAHVNVAFDQIIRLVEQWLERNSIAIAGYSSRDLSARLTQRIAELTLTPYSRHCMRRLENGVDPVVKGPAMMNLDGLLFNFTTGAVRPSLRLFVKSLAEFSLHWLHVLVNFFPGLWHPGLADKRPATCVFGIGMESLFIDGGDARFVQFCRQGRITPLAAAHRLIIQAASPRISSDPEHFHYGRFPLFILANTTPMRVGTRVKGVLDHLRMLWTFFGGLYRWPFIVVLARDFAYIPLVTMLDRLNAIEATVITNSTYSSQPLWMRGSPGRRFAVHMIWYSQNTIPFVYAQDRIASDLPNYRHLKVDESWLWTQEYANYLEHLGVKGKMHVIGPILWYLPGKPVDRHSGNEIRIAIFDVTPVSMAFAQNFGLIYNYYRAETMARFIEEIVAVRKEIESRTKTRVRLLLKHKRDYYPMHDARYVELIEQRVRRNDLELVPHQADVYSLLEECHFSISIPYTSTAYIANHIGIPAIYFDPMAELVPTHATAPFISFASGRSQLLETALRLIMYPQGASSQLTADCVDRCSDLRLDNDRG